MGIGLLDPTIIVPLAVSATPHEVTIPVRSTGAATAEILSIIFVGCMNGCVFIFCTLLGTKDFKR